MGQEATQEVEDAGKEDGIDLEDVLIALAIDARQNPETFNADSLHQALVAAGLEDIWEDAGAANEDEEGEEDEDEDEDEVSGDDAVTDDDEDEEAEEGEGDEDEAE